MTDIKAPEGGRPVSELQERLARAIYESRYGRHERDEYWKRRVKDMREVAEMFPNTPFGGDSVSDAFRDALAAMKAMREPTPEMVEAGWNARGEVDARYRAMIDREISIAEGGKDGD